MALTRTIICDPLDSEDAVGYWRTRERWERLGKQVQEDQKYERTHGTKPHGADTRRHELRRLGKLLDRNVKS